MIKRRRRDMCKSHEPMPEIPFELVIEILTRLPAKSLMKFKSVSKIWSSVICSRCFTNRFLRGASSPPRLYMSLHFFDDSHMKAMLLSLSPGSGSDGATMSCFDVDQDLTIPGMRGIPRRVYRGLMCLIKGLSVQIYNTTTRQLVVLPDIEESRLRDEGHESLRIMCHVGHDPVHDQYKVVCVAARLSDEGTILSERWVFLLKGDGSSGRWKNISCGSPPHLPLTRTLNINGRVHYLGAVSIIDYVLVSFDISSEKFSMLQIPKGIIQPDIGLIEYGGKIALFNIHNLENDGVIELWVVEDEETNMRGSKTLVLQLHPSEMHMVNDISLKVIGTTQNGEVLLIPRVREDPLQHFPLNVKENLFNVFIYDIQKNHMRKIEIKATPNRHHTEVCQFVGLDDVENLIHL